MPWPGILTTQARKRHASAEAGRGRLGGLFVLAKKLPKNSGNNQQTDERGQPPEQGMAFARRDKLKGFFPENCAWLTKSESGKLNATHVKLIGIRNGRKARK